jgi:hypothetical protein
MPERDKPAEDAAPSFAVRNLEELVALAQWPRAPLADLDLVEPAELHELDSIRQMREFVLDTSVDTSIYRSGT